MAAKNYRLTINKSDGTSDQINFSIPDQEGTYKIQFTLSNGEVIDAGNVTVSDIENTYNLALLLSSGQTINAGQIKTPIATTPTLAEATWAQIEAASLSGNAEEYWAVGDEKTITLTTGEEVTLVILGFNHDDLADGSGKAGITFGMKNLLATIYRMNASNTNIGGWNRSEMRTSTMATLLSQIPSDLQSVIKQVNKKATAGNESTSITTSADKLWLLAEVEVDGTTSAGYADEGEQYEYWKTVKDGTVNADRIKYLSNGSGSAEDWWLRSPHVRNSTGFRGLVSTGYFNTDNATNDRGVSFGFCV